MKRIMLIILAVVLLVGCVTVASCLRKPDKPINPAPDPAEIIDRSITTLISSDIWDVGEYAFVMCDKLTHVDLSGSSRVMIGQEAFSGCCALETAMFSTLMVVDTRAFFGCERLTSVVFYDVALGEPYVGDDVFAGTPIERGEGYIYVPKRRLEFAKELFWPYGDQVRAIEDWDAK